MKNRKPAVSGSFYSNNPKTLEKELSMLFRKAVDRKHSNVRAILLPHAGYAFSGSVAASAVKQLDSMKQYKRIFILASSHQLYFSGVSIYSKGNYEIPLGTISIDHELINLLVGENSYIKYIPNAHKDEHCIEVVLPLLRHHLEHDFTIIPIIIGGENPNTAEALAKVLQPYFTEDNLFVVSTDFSHYPEYIDAIKTDRETAEAICSGNVNHLKRVLKQHEKTPVPNLLTDLCGASAVETLMHITENENISYSVVDYKNSGDSKYGSKDKVVGYYAIVAH